MEGNKPQTDSPTPIAAIAELGWHILALLVVRQARYQTSCLVYYVT